MGERFEWNMSQARMGEILRQAVYAEDRVTIDHLLRVKVNLESGNEKGVTALHIAANTQNPSALAFLIGKKADIETRDSEGFTPLIWAVNKGSLEVVESLLNARADPGMQTFAGQSVLSMCAERGHVRCCEALLEHRAEVDGRNGNGSTALMCASHRAEVETMKMLLRHGANVNTTDQDGWSPIFYAANGDESHGHAGSGRRSPAEATELLVTHRADPLAVTEGSGMTAAHVAAGRNSADVIRKLREACADLNAKTGKGQTPLMVAACYGAVDVVRTLLKQKGNPNAVAVDVNLQNNSSESALALAEKYIHPEVARLLTQAGAVSTKSGAKKKGKGKKK